MRDAKTFIESYREFSASGLKIVDFDGGRVEIAFPDGRREWLDDADAAFEIEWATSDPPTDEMYAEEVAWAASDEADALWAATRDVPFAELRRLAYGA